MFHRVDDWIVSFIDIMPHDYIECSSLDSCSDNIQTEIVDENYGGREQVLKTDIILGILKICE